MADYTYTIDQLLEDQLPAGFVLGTDYVTHRKMYWQNILYIQAGVAADDRFTDESWDPDWSMLIGYLIIWDVFQKAITGKIFQASSMGLNGTVTSKGPVKKIVTGPIEAEYTDTTAAFASLLRGFESSEGPFFEIFTNACALAQRIGIKIPMCKPNFIRANIQKAKRHLPAFWPYPVSTGPIFPYGGYDTYGYLPFP